MRDHTDLVDEALEVHAGRMALHVHGSLDELLGGEPVGVRIGDHVEEDTGVAQVQADQRKDPLHLLVACQHDELILQDLSVAVVVHGEDNPPQLNHVSRHLLPMCLMGFLFIRHRQLHRVLNEDACQYVDQCEVEECNVEDEQPNVRPTQGSDQQVDGVPIQASHGGLQQRQDRSLHIPEVVSLLVPQRICQRVRCRQLLGHLLDKNQGEDK
mmetsp:Transcript_127901/g.409720  ORF Transcript_127901/g.409720 Transcript_127901/m.409720 type:complete len:212 (+) Transcript_127901:390-1025(+)